MIAMAYDNDAQCVDFVRNGGNLQTDEGLETAVLLSLFSDARATEEDDVDPEADQGGWWGTQFLTDPAPSGSKLYLLRSAKLTNDTLLAAVDYCKDALQWLVDAKVAKTIEATAERMQGRNDAALMTISIQRPRDVAPRFKRAWEVEFGR